MPWAVRVALNFIERGVAQGAPAGESWRVSYGLSVTMVWLYIEMLRLISYQQVAHDGGRTT